MGNPFAPLITSSSYIIIFSYFGGMGVSFAWAVSIQLTPPKFNIAPEKWWLEDEFPFGIAYFRGLC